MRDPVRMWIRGVERPQAVSDTARPYIEQLLEEKEMALNLQIDEAWTRTREARWARTEKKSYQRGTVQSRRYSLDENG